MFIVLSACSEGKIKPTHQMQCIGGKVSLKLWSVREKDFLLFDHVSSDIIQLKRPLNNLTDPKLWKCSLCIMGAYMLLIRMQ